MFLKLLLARFSELEPSKNSQGCYQSLLLDKITEPSNTSQSCLHQKALGGVISRMGCYFLKAWPELWSRSQVLIKFGFMEFRFSLWLNTCIPYIYIFSSRHHLRVNQSENCNLYMFGCDLAFFSYNSLIVLLPSNFKGGPPGSNFHPLNTKQHQALKCMFVQFS